MAIPDPSQVAPWYLRNITQALQLDEATGNVFVRTGIQGNIYITGPVTIPGTVTVASTAEDPVHVHLDEIGTSGILNVPYMPIGNTNVAVTGGNVAVTGNVNSIVTGNVGIVGNVSVNPITGNVGIVGNVNVAITSGNVGLTGNLAGITGNVTVVDGGGSLTVDGNVNATITGGNIATTIGGTNLDAFGRLRVSDPYTLFDSALNGQRRYDFSSLTTGTASVTFDYNANVRRLNVNSASGDQVIRESMNCLPYQPGKSLLTMNSFCMSPAKTNLRQRLGFFTTNNGIYFEQTGLVRNMVIRSYSSGTITEERIAQSSWNGDKLDGSGASGITLNTAATQIFYTDIEWLGVGSVRTGFIINGQFITCHTFNHANNPAFATTYMGTATLPVRFEITNTGATTGASTMQQICSTVISEGGYNNAYFTYTAGTGITPRRLSSGGTYYPMASFRLAAGYLNSVVKLAQVDILSPTVNYYRWTVLKNATLTGATWTSASSTTRVEADTAATAVTGGESIQSGYVSSRELSELSSNFYGQLGRTLVGVSDTLTLAIAATSNNADVLAQIGWQEII